uniref:Mitochondrial resolvase Ydc2 catalytic domain-containing protein n=1 Tax=viral metagenome TaxID=1070528 RepID=A0A6C0D5Y4_9ZZZZ
MPIQKLASFDIGIKNMAVCIFETPTTTGAPSIQTWEILNLMNTEPSTAHTCNCPLKQTKKNAPIKLCNKKAKYSRPPEKTYCEKHATQSTEYIIPDKSISPATLKKHTYEELIPIAQKYKIFENKDLGKIAFEKTQPPPSIPTTKKGLLEIIIPFFEENTYKVLVDPKKKTANNTDLISIGKNMTRLLDEIPDMTNGTITHVILENQIGILANRMKTIQGMLAQYFIMRGRHDIHIEFVSSANKLKDLANTKETENNYKQHKKDGIFFCKQFLEKNTDLGEWSHVLETPKRDDLADCFLQGIWYLKREKIITYAEDLKINSILLS